MGSKKDTYEELKRLHTENFLKPISEQDPTINERLLEFAAKRCSSTGGRGIKPQVDIRREQRIDADNQAHGFRLKRKETDPHNFDYVEESKRNVEHLASNLDNRINDLNINIEDCNKRIKLEPKCEPDLMNQYDVEDDVYDKYDFFSNQYSNLPILKYAGEILKQIEFNNIIIIQGNTGCGKTTQVPQIILDHHAKTKKHCNIVVTQPRRLGAISISKRVCQEKNWPIGSVCGYQIGLDKRKSQDTRLLYVTNSLLKEQFIGKGDFIMQYTHIILDEIHDREIDTDFVILLVKLSLRYRFQGKLILMSATLDPGLLQRYFANESLNKKVPLIRCEIKLHQVKVLYLEEISQLGIQFNEGELIKDPLDLEINEEVISLVGNLISYFDHVEIENDRGCNTINGFHPNRGSVLIFVTGFSSIGRIEDFLKYHFKDNDLWIMPLHADIPIEQQIMVNDKPKLGHRKIIISTNIAESSITVPDIKYVIDFCKTKSLFCDPETNYTMLRKEWASKSNLDQRKGRAGRVADGSCYRLITRDFYETLNDYPEPAMSRQPLDKIVLDIKRLKRNSSPKEILGLALTPPRLDEIEITILKLKEVGAISLYKNSEFCAVDGDLTWAGEIMGQLPIDVKLAKLILFGLVFGKLRESIIIASALTLKTIFKKMYRSEIEAYRGKFTWSDGLFCDFNCILNAYNLWERKKEKRSMSNKQRNKWAYEQQLQLNQLVQLDKIKKEIEKRLASNNIHVDDSSKYEEDVLITTDVEALNNNYIIKFIVTGAFYPNYFTTEPVDPINVIKTLNGKNPRNTVLVKGFTDNQGILYHNQLKKLFYACGKNLTMHYERNKAFVEFKGNFDIHTKVSFEVYISVLMRKVNYKNRSIELEMAKDNDHNMRILHFINSAKKAESHRYITACSSRMTVESAEDTLSDPSLLIGKLNEFEIVVTQIDRFGYFWAQIKDERFIDNLEQIQNGLNGYHVQYRQINPRSISIGATVVALFIDSFTFEYSYYRAKITEIINKNLVKVHYIDYGNSEKKDKNLLYEMPEQFKNTPHQAFECKIAKIRLNPFISNSKQQSKSAVNDFCQAIESSTNLRATVYSIVDSIVHITLFDLSSNLVHVDISSRLIKLGLCESCDESTKSLLNHNERMNLNYIQSSENQRSSNEWITVKNLENELGEVQFSKHDKFELKGCPWSPLEIQLNPLTQKNRLTRSSRVKIAPDSINYILLDDEPDINCSSLLVSHKIESTEKSSQLILRNTCLLPKVRGLISLCLLAFSPMVELRVDKNKKKYCGALCGLGYDTHLNKALYSENDVEEEFDVDIDHIDIREINSLRMIFNSVIGDKTTSQKLLHSPGILKAKQTEACTMILKQLKKNRKLVKKDDQYRQLAHDEYKWNRNPHTWYFDKDLTNAKRLEKMRRKNNAYYLLIKQIDFTKVNRI